MDVSGTRRRGRGRAVGVLVLLASAGFGGTVGAGPVGAGGRGPYLEPVESDTTGSTIYAGARVFRTGDRVHLFAPNVYKQDRTWHGPYTVYLRPDIPEAGLAGLAPAGEGANDVEVGNLEVNRLDDQTVTAEITFTLPKLADGSYFVMTCNAKCANPLGQLQTSTINVGAVPLPTLPPTTVLDVSAVTPSVTARVGNVATTVRPLVPAVTPAPVVREVPVTTTNWAAVGAAFAFGLAVAWGVPSLRRRQVRVDPAGSSGRAARPRARGATPPDLDGAGFIPVEAVHEESLV